MTKAYLVIAKCWWSENEAPLDAQQKSITVAYSGPCLAEARGMYHARRAETLVYGQHQEISFHTITIGDSPDKDVIDPPISA